MKKDILGIILAGGEGRRLIPLTTQRAKPAVPFGGKYRIIDFVLSNFLNSEIASIFVLTQFRSQSLAEHIINGWNISNNHSRKQFIVNVPAQMQTDERRWYSGTADAIYQNRHLIENFRPKMVAVFGGDHIYRMDIQQMADYHKEKSALVTVAAIPVPVEEASQFGVIEVDEENRIIGFQEKPSDPKTIPGDPSKALVSMGNYIFECAELLSLLGVDSEDSTSTHDFGHDILPTLVDGRKLFAYNFFDNKIPNANENHQPYWRDIGTLKAFYDANMDLRSTDPMLDLYNSEWPIYNYHFSQPPAKFVHDDQNQADGTMKKRIGRAIDSIVCDGCIVSGATVKDSILFNSVHAHSYSSINDSIIMNNVDIGENTRIMRTIIDKHVKVPANISIGYDKEKDKKFFTVLELDELDSEGKETWLTVIPKNFDFNDIDF